MDNDGRLDKEATSYNDPMVLDLLNQCYWLFCTGLSIVMIEVTINFILQSQKAVFDTSIILLLLLIDDRLNWVLHGPPHSLHIFTVNKVENYLNFLGKRG